MRTIQIYDLPTRIFHWLFAGFFIFAFVVAKTVDDELPLFSWHMLAGLTLGFMVVLRIIWGFVGTRHARFAASLGSLGSLGGFDLNPAHLVAYFKGILSGDRTKWAGHNPASSWAAIVMFGLALGLGVTGYLMTSGPDKEAYEDIHEILANAFLLTVILHIVGVVFHALRHKDQIFMAMVDGKKSGVEHGEAISDTHLWAGLAFVATVAGFVFFLRGNYDESTGVLSIGGKTLQLGEGPEGSEGEAGENSDTGEKVSESEEGEHDDED